LLQYCLQCLRNTLHLGVRRRRTMQDEAVAHFVLVTGADAKTAEGLIEVCSFHLRFKTHVYFCACESVRLIERCVA